MLPVNDWPIDGNSVFVFKSATQYICFLQAISKSQACCIKCSFKHASTLQHNPLSICPTLSSAYNFQTQRMLSNSSDEMKQSNSPLVVQFSSNSLLRKRRRVYCQISGGADRSRNPLWLKSFQTTPHLTELVLLCRTALARCLKDAAYSNARMTSERRRGQNPHRNT